MKIITVINAKGGCGKSTIAMGLAIGLTRHGHRVLLMDLGVARPTTAVAPLTMVGEFVGSMAYAAPEQFEDDGGRLGPWTDLYALGATLHHLATGSHPFVTQMMADPTQEERHLTPSFRRILARVRQQAPERRYPTADALREALEAR